MSEPKTAADLLADLALIPSYEHDSYLTENWTAILAALKLASQPRITVEMLEKLENRIGDYNPVVSLLIQYLKGEVAEL